MLDLRRHGAIVLALAVSTAACADDRPGALTGERSSAVIVSTTTVAPPATDGAEPADDTSPTVTGDTVDTPSPPTTNSPATTSETEPTTTTSSPSIDPVVGEPRVGRERVTEIDRPVDLAVRPGDDALHLVSQRGRIVRVDPSTGEQTETLDIADLISGGDNEQGLLGLAFSVDGDRAYIDYTNTDGDTVIAEYTVDPSGVLDQDAARILLTVDQPYSNHNAGDLAIGPDGLLYVTLGDGGSGGDPERRASDPSVLLGSILRIDPTPSADLPYTIPPDNPFATGTFEGLDGAPEVWAWGLRNPWKIAFDPVNGDLWIADVGQNQFEEIDRVRAGDHPAGFGVDFGWSAFEGTQRYNADVPDSGRVTFPVLTYEHGDDGCSVSGGEPYRGSAIPELEPAYVYSDYCSGRVWALDLAGQRNLVLLDGFEQVTAIRAGPDGELYVLQASGGVDRLVAA